MTTSILTKYEKSLTNNLTENTLDFFPCFFKNHLLPWNSSNNR